ncbi:hypothetical protein LZ31DRAFT_508698 [Colletotrichum somersetense]|nr:hypothetical protein LZ31DRAFT_508698 [Colletotrichum somersetense]
MDEYPRGHLWAEHETNQAPEVVIHSAPEAVQIPLKNLSTKNDGADNPRRVHPDGDIAVSNHTEQTSHSKLKRCSRLWTWKTSIGVCIGLLILAIVIAVMTTVVANDRGHGPESIETTAISSAPQASSSFVTSTPSSAIPHPSTVFSQPPECAKSKFFKAVNWIGIDTDNTNWKYNMHQTKTAEECCIICYHSTHDGCNGWLYLTGESFIQCSIIHGFSGPNIDDDCPNGRPGIVFAKTNDSDNYGGPGPCAGSVRV